MANQNNRGGGFLLWGINFVSSKIRNRKIRKYNTQARGLKQHANVTADFLFPPQSYQENIIISGGGSGDRLRFCEQILRNAQAQSQAVIVLTAGNVDLENLIAGGGLGIAASRQRKIFDAFTFLEMQDICQVILETNRQKYDIKHSGRYVLQVVFDVLQAQNLKPYFANFADFTYHKIPARINDCLARGLISQSKANDLNSYLAMGQSELSKIDAFFYNARAQMLHIAEVNPNNSGGFSALSAIWNNQIFLIDINSPSNTMLLELIVNTLLVAKNKGMNFSLMIDDIAISSSDSLKRLLSQRANHNNIIISQDVFTMLNGEERTFASAVGLADRTILLSHSSHISCEMWSKYIGNYDKIDLSRSAGGGWFQSSRWGYMSNQTQTETMKREQKIKPEEINRLPQGQIFAYDRQSGNLIQANVL